MENVNTKAQCLKKLKELGIYEKAFFSMKMVDLHKIIQEKLDKDAPPKKITINEPIFEEEPLPEEKETEEDKNLTKHQKNKIKKEKVVKKLLAKPVFEYKKQIVIEPDNYTGKPLSKHQLRIQQTKKLEEEQEQEILTPKVKVNKLQKIIKQKIDYKKAIQSLMKKLNDDIIELLKDFDNEKNLSVSDKEMIDIEYKKILDEAYIELEKQLEEVDDDNYIALIQRKIKIIDDKVNEFLED
jgi:hypothetical protein